MDLIINFLKLHRISTALLLALVVVIAAVVFTNRLLVSRDTSASPLVQELTFDPDGPYGVLIPRRDGNALKLLIGRVSSVESISYELAYQSVGIDRGVMGDIHSEKGKSEYEQEILLGSCSKNICVYDKEVENGTLTLSLKKGAKIYKAITQWHLQRPHLALGVLTSGDGHFAYRIERNTPNLGVLGYSVINDLIGAPRLPGDKMVLGKVYSLSTPLGKQLPTGQVSIELSQPPKDSGGIYRFDEGENRWVELITEVKGEKLSAPSPSGGIFAVLVPKS